MVNLSGHAISEIISGAAVTVTVPPQLSEVTIDVVFGAGTRFVHSTVIFAGHVIARYGKSVDTGLITDNIRRNSYCWCSTAVI